MSFSNFLSDSFGSISVLFCPSEQGQSHGLIICQKGKPRSFSASSEGIRRLNQARASETDDEGKPLTYERLAPRAN
ncbi:MAG: hypothetical protein F6K50_01765 [Moorea sp. SIO3I7]|uniref:hypothetical protein n=1 Tax=Moorena sp. SIO3I8 TaxID=2607833 RepID=UPI0013BF57E6|nr:hypothetical protein [Moorena sp. SIO3I8]NEN94304.1 hypothetical protein [Moorena sp. SIO3I7]NEO06002.1 hypothetical protein [Moorena sp. SIO3I8]